MEDLFSLSVLDRLLGNNAIIIDGVVYSVDRVSKDAHYSCGSKTYSLSREGHINDLIMTEKNVISKTVQTHVKQSIDDALSNVLGITLGDDAILFMQCLQNVLPYLDDGDSRVESTAISELSDIRKKEFRSEAQPKCTDDINEELIRTKIQENLILAYFSENTVNSDVYASRLNINNNICFIGKEGKLNLLEEIKEQKQDAANQKKQSQEEPNMQKEASSSSELKYDVLFWKQQRHKRFFKITEHDFLPISAFQVKRLLKEAITTQVQELSNEKIRSHVEYLKNAAANSQLILKEDIDYQNCGIRKTQYDGQKCLFVYMKPKPFAMHDIRIGHEHKWYPFRTPPEVGMLLRLDNCKKGCAIGRGDLFFGSIYVNGDFDYIHFSSKKGVFSSFCGTGSYSKKDDETWQESVVRYIQRGVDTLYNGLTEQSMSIHSGIGGILGEGYKRPLSKLEWITEDQVEKEKLKKTNLYELVLEAKK